MRGWLSKLGLVSVGRALTPAAAAPGPVAAVLIPLTVAPPPMAARRRSRAEGKASGHAATSSARLVLVEDDLFITEAWQRAFASDELLTFTSPLEFWAAVEDGRLDLDLVDTVVTDFYFDNGRDDDGHSFAAELKSCRAAIHVSIATDASLSSPGRADEIIGKCPYAFRSRAAARPDACRPLRQHAMQ